LLVLGQEVLIARFEVLCPLCEIRTAFTQQQKNGILKHFNGARRHCAMLDFITKYNMAVQEMCLDLGKPFKIPLLSFLLSS